MKQVLIINGSGGVGKDTFVNLLNKYKKVIHRSIAYPAKEIAKQIGWDGSSKTEKDRKFLSDIKVIVGNYNDGNYKYIQDEYKKFCQDKITEILCIDMREKADIERAVKDFGAKTVLITRKQVKHITSNMADKQVFDIEYDYRIENDGTLKDLDRKAFEFSRILEQKELKLLQPDFKKAIYISHPYGGESANKAKIEQIISFLTKKFPDFLFLSPVNTFGFLYNQLTYSDGIARCLWLLTKCDGMIVLGDYEQSKGCKIEIEFCKKHNIPIEFFAATGGAF